MLVLSLLNQNALLMTHPHLNLRVSLPRVCHVLPSPSAYCGPTCSCCPERCIVISTCKTRQHDRASMQLHRHCVVSDLSPVML